MNFICTYCSKLLTEDEVTIVGATAKHYKLYLCTECSKNYLDKNIEEDHNK